MTNIVVTDGYTLNPGDLDWTELKKQGNVTVYPRTPQEDLIERIKKAEVIIVNKQIIDQAVLEQLPLLKCICVTATGFNNINLEVAQRKNIIVSNVKGYSTPSVVQHVIALLLKMTNQVTLHHNSVMAGHWSKQTDFCYTLHTIHELSDLTLGIYGFGRIGQHLAKIAQGFGMKILAHHKHPQRDAMEGVEFVDLAMLFKRSNVISLHAPLQSSNEGIVNKELLSLMPKPSYLINTGRGGLINEPDLVDCLQNKTLDMAALDVMSTEPPLRDHPLLHLNNCIVTPHMAWASKASRQRLLNETILNLQSYLAGQVRNSVY